MSNIGRRTFLAASVLGADGMPRPNILFAIADDWSWPHAGAYGASGVRTPSFDRVAREGCLFTTAIVAAPQCSPNRAATLTGRPIWQLEEAGTHASIFPTTYPVYTDVLESGGYHVGFTCKGWGPGDWERGGWTRNPAGDEYNTLRLDAAPASGIRKVDYAGNFEAFLRDRPEGAPFCFWFGASEPHRAYEEGSGLKAGKTLGNAPLPPFLPDTETVRSDVLDYALEIEWFDTQLGAMLEHLESIGELDNTLVVVTGDNGMPFPSAKANLYEYGIHVPLAMRWPARVRGGQTIAEPVSFIDFAPTFLEAAGAKIPETMIGRSLLPALLDGAPHREFALSGRERHTHERHDNLGYPSRAIRTNQFLYLRNFKPDRWPAGDPPEFHDIDNSPTKTLVLEQRDRYPTLWAQAVGKRPPEELYAVQDDPSCLRNLADDATYAEVRETLYRQLLRALADQGDPRALGTGDIFDSYPRVSGMRPELGGFAERGEYNVRYGR